ncbi:ankyrin repeat-containing protein NPR4 [Cryptomeria japonica]|uniref:ankyrin repeat-containing protein NPR4 n=1 Tax=Cryptomeria japonica TaxID=3369 RepID=UPI0025AC6FF7|nr:ankyrin repeat-containing protein NPR4 [Cryptomeria japonica]
MENVLAFFKACEMGNIVGAKNLLEGPLDLLNLIQHKTWEGRTCFHMAIISGSADLLRMLARKLRDADLINIIKEGDRNGETALHLAVRKTRVDLVKQLVELDANLCDCANKEGETPLKLAVSLVFKGAVEFLVTRTSNALHYIVELNQVKLVEYLIKKGVKLSKLINQPYQPATNPPDDEGNRATNQTNLTNRDTQEDQLIVRRGDTPLHIAARNKYESMVNLLLKVPDGNKFARNSEEMTPFDIAREVTEYHESFRIIKKLGDFSRSPKVFMYCVPQVSRKKYKNASLMVDKAYEERRNAELVVAALLATMTCAAAFTVPGGFESESDAKEDPGSPLLLSFTSFKLFIIFNCIAFFLSLFVCIMWEMSSQLTTENKMVFMTINSLVICYSFAFTAYGFMAAVYAMLERKAKTFSWVVLGSLIFISLCGVLAFARQSIHFVVKRARFHRLCGVSLLLDETAEKVWSGAEYYGLLNLLRSADEIIHDFIAGHCKFRPHREHEGSFNHV